MKRLISFALISLIAAGNIFATNSILIAEIINNSGNLVVAHVRKTDCSLHIAAGKTLECNISINLSWPTLNQRLHPITFAWYNHEENLGDTFFLDFRKSESLSGALKTGIFLSTAGAVFSWTKVRSSRCKHPQPAYCIVFDKATDDRVKCSIREIATPSPQ